jgi:cell shape-determining protein MreD
MTLRLASADRVSEALRLRKKKYWMPTLVTCLIVLLLVSYTLASEMTLERDTLHYICSSIVQGFAAFVGILFVAPDKGCTGGSYRIGLPSCWHH